MNNLASALAGTRNALVNTNNQNYYNNNPSNKLKSFKIVLDSRDTNSWTSPTGVICNANYPINLQQFCRREEYLDKSYEMSFQFQGTTEPALTHSNVYTTTITLNNGYGTDRIYQYTNTYPVSGLLNILQDTSAYSTAISITATTASTNYVTVSTTSALKIGQQILIYSGTPFGGLQIGYYTISSIISSTQITLNGFTATTSTGTMSAYAYLNFGTYSQFLNANYSDNAPTKIKTIDGLTNINVAVFTNQAAGFYHTSLVSYVLVLYFEEIEGA